MINKHDQERLEEIAHRMDVTMGCSGSYEHLVRLINSFAATPLPDVTKTLEWYAQVIREEMSLEERKQAFLDNVLEKADVQFGWAETEFRCEDLKVLLDGCKKETK